MSAAKQLYELQELDQEIDSQEQALSLAKSQLGESQAVLKLQDQLQQEQQQLEELGRKQHGAEWEIELTPIAGGKQIADTLNFNKGKFISGKLNTQGFTASNYSLTIEDTGKIIWETMQTSPDGIASWRGEIEQGIMRGILSLRSGDQTQDFSFISIRYRRRR